MFPYSEEFSVNSKLPEHGVDPERILFELDQMAKKEDAFWQTGKCSGTMYCGDHEHYEFLTKAFQKFCHVNPLQRDMCPSSTKFEAEIIAMTLDLLRADSITDSKPGGLVTTGGTGSILHAILAYREYFKSRKGIVKPNIIKPETAHAAFDKAGHILGVEVRKAPIEDESKQVDLRAINSLLDENTICIIGSACNYGYGVVDDIEGLSKIALEHQTGLHVDACLGGFILPFGQELGYEIPVFDYRLPGVTSISADTHKYGYALKGSSVLTFRDKHVRNAQYFYLTDWSGGKYCSPGIEGSRSGGMLASTWASLLKLGRSGYLNYAREIFSTADKMKEIVRSHKELQILGKPTFCFAFNSDQFDIYHVNDYMRERGWRFNGQQYPNAIHMAVTRPQTKPGVVENFQNDLSQAVLYAKDMHAQGAQPFSGAIYGGIQGGMNSEADQFIREVMESMLDEFQEIPF